MIFFYTGSDEIGKKNILWYDVFVLKKKDFTQAWSIGTLFLVTFYFSVCSFELLLEKVKS